MIKDMAKIINDLSYKNDRYRVFSDFVEMSAISISNAVDKPQFEKREADYMAIVKRYDRKDLEQFPKMLGMLVMTLEGGFDDVLGKLFHELELHNEHRGQFFTPYPICKMMAMMTANHVDTINDRGFITASEPACGAGAMIIALAETMKEQDINYQHALHVTAVDVDPRCVHMAYTQFSLLHIPAVVIQGNTLTMEEKEHWYTPAHVIGGWTYRLKAKGIQENMMKILEPQQPDIEPENVEEIRHITQTQQLKLF